MIIDPYKYAVGIDPDFASVSLLLHLDGTDGSTTITDSSSNALTCAANGTVQLKTAQAKFGPSSAGGTFTSTSNNNIQVLNDVGAKMSLPGDMTIEIQVYWTSSPAGGQGSPTFLSKRGVATDIEYWFLYFAGNLYFFYTTDGSTFQSVNVAWSPSTSTWYHVAACRSGSNLRFFVDGTQQGSTQTVSGALYAGLADSYIFTDAINAHTFDGYLDEVRVTKGVARYTSNFTAPIAAFPDS